jgi:hypothetical protein
MIGANPPAARGQALVLEYGQLGVEVALDGWRDEGHDLVGSDLGDGDHLPDVPHHARPTIWEAAREARNSRSSLSRLDETASRMWTAKLVTCHRSGS